MNSLSRSEFVLLLAMMFATVAISIDAMLPALPDIGAELSPGDPNKAQLVLAAFALGLGLGTFLTGPLSDSYGRKRVILLGFGLYAIGAFLAWLSISLEVTLIARALQGLGAAAPRIVGIAVVRDLYSGRDMARLMSLAMMIFTILPALGPLIGSWIILWSSWHGIFLAFVFFAFVLSIWVGLRLPESLPPENRRPFRFGPLAEAVKQMMQTRVAFLAMLVQSLCMCALFSTLLLVQPIYDLTFDKAASFPYWFGVVAVLSASGAAVNAHLVVRVGMQNMVHWSLIVLASIAAVLVIAETLTLPADVFFGVFVFFQTALFFIAGTTLGNLQSLAMEPLGHIAGLVASVMGGVSTVMGALVGSLVGQAFGGQVYPLSCSTVILCLLGVIVMTRMRGLPDRDKPQDQGKRPDA